MLQGGPHRVFLICHTTHVKVCRKKGKTMCQCRSPPCIIYCLYLVHNIIYALIECNKPITIKIQGIRFLVFYVRHRGVVIILCKIPMVKKFFDKSR